MRSTFTTASPQSATRPEPIGASLGQWLSAVVMTVVLLISALGMTAITFMGEVPPSQAEQTLSVAATVTSEVVTSVAWESDVVERSAVASAWTP
ncbi:MAG: hypothetical protein AAFS10_27420 [Myxococcota bacterium]